MNERKHHPFGFSKWPMLIKCGHYESEDRETDATKEGTAKHEDLEELINERNTGVPALHESAGAKWAVEYMSSIAGFAAIHSETYVEVDTGGVSGKVFGYCDAWFVKDDELYVFDYKSGAKSNLDYFPQVMGYACGLMQHQVPNTTKTDKIHCFVLYGASHDIVSCDFTMSELSNMTNAVMYKVNNGTRNCTCVNAGCQFCKHKGGCKAMNDTAVAVAQNTLPQMSDAKKYDTLLCIKSACERMIEDLKDVARVNGGVLDDGETRFELRRDSHGRMKSVDVPMLKLDLLGKGIDIDPAIIMSRCSITKTAFKDLAKADAKLHGVKVKELDEMYDARCVFGEPSEKMVKVA